MLLRSTSILFTLLLATAVTAQVGVGRIHTNNLPGDGVLPAGAVNVTLIEIASTGGNGTDNDDHRGVARLPNGHYIVTQSQEGGLIPKRYFEFGSDGTFLNGVDQPFLTGAVGDIGLTDLAWDQETDASSRIWAGRAKGVMSYDWNAQAFDQVIFPGSPNGLHVLETYVGTDIRTAAIAEVDGLKIFVSSAAKGFRLGNPDDSDTNFHIMGLPLPCFPPWQPATQNINGPLGAPDQGKLGAAWDPIAGTIWFSLDTRTNNPNPNHSAIRFVEMGMDGVLTGQVVQGVRGIGGIANGCEMYVNAQGERIMVYMSSMGTGETTPIGITSDQDVMIEMHMGFEYGASCGGDIAFETEPYIGNLGWTITIENAPANPLSAAFLFRGKAVVPPGLVFPGLLNCGLLLDLGSLISEGGTIPLVNGSASFVRPLPDSPSLIGAEAGFQWLLPTTLGVLPLDLSDAGAFMVGTNL